MTLGEDKANLAAVPAASRSRLPSQSLVAVRGILRTVEPPPRARFPLRIPELDSLLGGGLPRGAITEVVGDASSGKTTLVQILVAAATRAGELVAWVDLPNALDAEGAEASGIALEQVLWVRPNDPMAAMRSAEHLLIVGGFRFVVLDLVVSDPSRMNLSAAMWLRMVHAVIRHEASMIVLGTGSRVGTFAALSLEACGRDRVFRGEGGPCPAFQGMTSSLQIRKNKLGSSQSIAVDFLASATA